MWNKFVYVLNQFFKEVPKNNPQDALISAKWKSSVDNICLFLPVLPYDCKDNNLVLFTFVHQKGCFQYKTEKVNREIEFCIFEVV